MNSIETFLKANNLKKSDLAKYLGIVPSNISFYCKTGTPLPEQHRDKLLKNKKGWDISAILEMRDTAEHPATLRDIADLLNKVLTNQKVIISLLSDK